MAAQWTVDLIGTGANPSAGSSIEHLLRADWTLDLGNVSVCAMLSSEPTGIRRFIGQIRPDLIILFLLESNCFLPLEILRSVAPACPIIAVVPEVPTSALIGLFQQGISDFVVLPIRGVDLLPRIGQLLLRRGCVE